MNRYLGGESISARGFNMIDRLARTLDRSQHDAEFRGWGLALPTGPVGPADERGRAPAVVHLAGLLAAFLVAVLVSHELVNRLAGPAVGHEVRRWGELALYPFSAILTGLAFFSMGSNYWGWCYAIGVGFFALAVAMPLYLDLAPLEFGTAWCLAFVTIGLHVRRAG